MYGQSSEVIQLVDFKGDATVPFIGKVEFAGEEPLRSKLQNIRKENSTFYEALSLDKFD